MNFKRKRVWAFIDLLCFLTINLGLVLTTSRVKPLGGGFYCDDVSIRLPHKEGTISGAMLAVILALIPIIIMLSVEIGLLQVSGVSNRRMSVLVVHFFTIFSFYLYGIGFTLIMVEVGKLVISRPRPHFLAVCGLDIHTFNCSSSTFIEDYSCTNPDFKVSDYLQAIKSFPSGHSALGLYMAIYVCAYLEMRLPPLQCYFLKPTMELLVLVMALVTSATRITDGHHFISDVLAGSLLGLVISGIMVFNLYRLLKEEIGYSKTVGVSETPASSTSRQEIGYSKTVGVSETPASSTSRQEYQLQIKQ